MCFLTRAGSGFGDQGLGLNGSSRVAQALLLKNSMVSKQRLFNEQGPTNSQSPKAA